MKNTICVLLALAACWACEERSPMTVRVVDPPTATKPADSSGCRDAIVGCDFSASTTEKSRLCPYQEQKLEISRPPGNASAGCAPSPICVCRCPQQVVQP